MNDAIREDYSLTATVSVEEQVISFTRCHSQHDPSNPRQIKLQTNITKTHQTSDKEYRTNKNTFSYLN